MSTEAPAAPAQAAAPAQPSLADAIQAHNAPQAPQQQQQAAAPEKPAAEVAAKPEAAPKAPAKSDAPKAKGLSALPAVGAEEPAKGEEKPAGTEQPDPADTPPPGLKPEAQIQWGKLRKIEKEHAEIKPQYEALKKQLEEIKAKPVIPEDVTKELEDHRQFRAAFEWQNTPEFKAAVSEPMAEQYGTVNMVVEFLGVDAAKVEKAMAEPNRMRRNELIKAALSESEKEVDATAISDVCNAATEMHKLHAKGNELREKALDMQNILKGRKEQETMAQRQEREAKFQQASNEVQQALNTKLSEFFKDQAIAEDIKNAAPAEDPMDQAYQAKAGVLLPAVVTALNAARAKIAEMEKRERARTNAKPNDTGGDARTQDTPTGGDKPITLGEAVAMQFGPHLNR